jgi:hypothetical protein
VPPLDEQSGRRGLTPEEVATYRRDGLVVPDFRLPPERLADMRDAAEQLVAARTDIRPEFIPLPHVPWQDSPKARGLAARFLDGARDPALLDLVESVIGPDIVFWTAALFCKPGGDGREIPWHQDGVYWPLRPPATVTLWLALDDSLIENGCLRIVPGSHRLGLLKHEQSDKDGLVLNTSVVASEIDVGAARCVELRAGQLSMHDIYLVHGSSPNTSPRRRCGLTLRYMPATTLYDRTLNPGAASSTAPVEFAHRPIWLVRGVDRAGNDFKIGH